MSFPRPAFIKGDKVKHPTLGTGIVKSRIIADLEDWKLQGYRYEVLIKGQLWSIPEDVLKVPSIKPNKIS